MIEAKLDIAALNLVKHEMLHSIDMMKHLRAAGIPIVGVLMMRGIEYGVMEWSRETSPDGDYWCMRWFDVNEPRAATKGWIKEASGEGEAYSWVRYRHESMPATTTANDEDDEL